MLAFNDDSLADLMLRNLKMETMRLLATQADDITHWLPEHAHTHTNTHRQTHTHTHTLTG